MKYDTRIQYIIDLQFIWWENMANSWKNCIPPGLMVVYRKKPKCASWKGWKPHHHQNCTQFCTKRKSKHTSVLSFSRCVQRAKESFSWQEKYEFRKKEDTSALVPVFPFSFRRTRYLRERERELWWSWDELCVCVHTSFHFRISLKLLLNFRKYVCMYFYTLLLWNNFLYEYDDTQDGCTQKENFSWEAHVSLFPPF